MFADPNEDNYRLKVNSPCINAGDPDYISDSNEVDLDGNPRLTGPRVDMGAYEFQLLRSDLNIDGIVNDLDLMIFQRDWKRDNPAKEE